MQFHGLSFGFSSHLGLCYSLDSGPVQAHPGQCKMHSFLLAGKKQLSCYCSTVSTKCHNRFRRQLLLLGKGCNSWFKGHCLHQVGSVKHQSFVAKVNHLRVMVLVEMANTFLIHWGVLNRGPYCHLFVGSRSSSSSESLQKLF